MIVEKLTLHEYAASGNCYKIRLTAALLGVALDRREYDILKGETRTPEFLAHVNANGRIPVLQIGDGENLRFLPESNAACWYLADGSALIPEDRFARADMLRWMFFEQYNHEPNVATLRPRSNAFKALLVNEALDNVWPLVAEGALRPVMDMTFPLAEAAQAHARMEAGTHIGKIVLEI